MIARGMLCKMMSCHRKTEVKKMKSITKIKQILSLILALSMMVAVMPVTASAADASRKADTIFFATDRHEETSKLQSLLQALAYEPGLVVLGGDHVNNTNSGSLASITSEIQSVYPGVQTFYTYAAHDPNVSADSSNPYAFARTGEVYEGEDYYVYGVDQDDMQSSSSASTASSSFKSWAASADESKVIFVMCHMPIHNRRGDNAGGATWMNALNEVGESHDVVFLWGHNHTGESSADTAVYFVGVGGSLTPQGGSTGTINFTYMNAGYIKNGYASMVVINDDTVDVTRYTTSGSVNATHSFERRFAVSHSWEVTEYVAATCTENGYQTAYCAACGETKTTVIEAVGHDYSSKVTDTCTGSYTVYTCTVCGDSYSEANPTENTYDAASALTEGESYVIVASNYALTYGSSAGKTSVTVSNGSISSNVTDAMIWTYENGMLSNSSSGSVRYINVSSSSSGGSNRPGGGSSSSRTITFSDSGVSVSYSSSKLKLGSYYLYHSNNSGFSARSSGSTVTLYQVNEAFGGTGEHTYETVTVDATCTAEGSVTYTCTSCGYSYSEVIPATGGHSYTSEVTEPTCSEAGCAVYTCTACGDTYTEVLEAPGHSYEAVVTAPTCTEGGFTTYTCTSCGDSFISDYTEADGHSYETAVVEATCTTDGSITHTCVCGDTYSEVIAAPGHSYEAVVTAPTCTEDGFTTHTCSVCGDTYTSEYTDALGHDYHTVTVEPTCTEGGYTASICAACGDSLISDETAALGHSYEAEVTEATCTEAGGTVYTCTSCGHSYIADEIAALGHDYESVVTEAGCETEGYTTHTCGRCGIVTVDSVVAALGHAYETIEIPATCTEDGSITRTCTRCDESNTEIVAAPGHSYEAVVTAPTCTEGGFTAYTCAVCGDGYISDYTDALGHVYEQVTLEATCTADGSITYTCVCGDSYTEILEAPGHNYETVVTAPTCTEGGCTTHTCTACGDSYVENETAALGHSYEAVVTAPTCTEGGCTTYTCTACGDSYVENEIAALGHSYTAKEEGGYLVYTCHCGHSYSEKLSASYNQVSAITSGERYVITVYSGSTYYALSHADNEISAVEVTVENGAITSEVTEDLLWDYADSKLSYTDGSAVYYLYGSNANSWWGSLFGSSLTVSSSNSSTVSFSGSKLKVGSVYLRYSNGSVSLNRSATTAYLFEEA